MDYNDLLAQLNIRISDSDNFAFTAEEKQDALTEAFNDSHVLTEVWDSSLTFNLGTYQYAKPSGVDVVRDIYIKPDNNQDEPEKIDSNLWEVVGANIHLKRASLHIPDGWTLYIKGYTKLDTDDTVSSAGMWEYILNLAQLKLFRMFGVKKSFKFVPNDTSVAEIVAMKNELQREVDEYRRRLPRSWEVA